MRVILSSTALLLLLSTSVTPCSAQSQDSGIGVGPVTKVELSAIDPKLVAKGKELFTLKCSACHKLGERYVGPDLSGVTVRRRAEWIMNMIINPTEMTQKDPVAQELLGEYLTQMATLNLSQDEARAALEYLREHDASLPKK